MKALRVLIIVCLVAVAAPSAFAVCGYCDQNTGYCVQESGLGTACGVPCCIEVPRSTCFASDSRPTLLAAEYDVATVVVTTPAKRTIAASRTVRTASLQQKTKSRSR